MIFLPISLSKARVLKKKEHIFYCYYNGQHSVAGCYLCHILKVAQEASPPAASPDSLSPFGSHFN